jgi:hypothetical protein
VQVILASGSTIANSFLNVLQSTATNFSNSAFLSGATTTTACASQGIALCFVPPLNEDNKISYDSVAFHNKRVSTLFAFARPVPISIPECPPFNPSTTTLYAVQPSGTFSSTY